MAAAVSTRTSPVPLFSLQKLVSVRTDGHEATGAPTASFLTAEEPKRTTFGSMMATIGGFAGIGSSGANVVDYASVPAQIATVAQGGYEGNAYFALYTTNSASLALPLAGSLNCDFEAY